MEIYNEFKRKIKLYLNDNLSELQRTNIRREITEMFHILSPTDKRNYIELLYPILRDNISAAFSSNNYQDIIDNFNEIKYSNRWKNESITNQIIMYNMLIFGYLFLYLEQRPNKKEYYLEANKLFKIISQYDLNNVGFNKDQFKNELEIYNRNKSFINAIKNNDIWTKLIFIIPFPVYISDKELSFIYKGTNVIFKTEVIPSKDSKIYVDRGFIDLEKDKYGLLNRTIIHLKVNKYLSPNKYINIFTADTTETRTQALIESIEIINYIINHYKLISNNYWIENISYKQIQTYSLKVYAGEKEIKNIPFFDENQYKISSHIPYLDEISKKKLIAQLSNNEGDFLWKTLLQDAKKSLLINNLRESIISLNISFENFMYSKFKLILKYYMGEDNTELFFQGKIPYEEHEASRIINKEVFYKLENLNVINSVVPSVYQIVKKYYKYVPETERIPLSKTKFNTLINKIRRNRNDIIHGNDVGELSSRDIKESIQSFEKISNLILEKHFS